MPAIVRPHPLVIKQGWKKIMRREFEAFHVHPGML
jgi:hypothetical protein